MGLVRLLLALMVFHSHSELIGYGLLPGQTAVEVFFLVSGFYMSLVLQEKYATCRAFYRSRVRRLFPAYWLVLCAGALALYWWDFHPSTCWRSYASALADHPKEGVFFALSQVLLIGQEWFFGLAHAPDGTLRLAPGFSGSVWGVVLVIQSWSLSLELAFYALAPWLARRTTRTLVLLFLVALGLRLGANLHGFGHSELGMRLFPLEAWLFLAGMLCHRAAPRFAALPGYAGPGALALLCAAIVGYGALPEPVRFPLLMATAWACMPLVFRLMRDNRLDRFVGELTYPFYLVHYLVIAVLEQSLEDASVPLLLGVTALAALVLWAVAIRPFHGRSRAGLVFEAVTATVPVQLAPAVAVAEPATSES